MAAQCPVKEARFLFIRSEYSSFGYDWYGVGNHVATILAWPANDVCGHGILTIFRISLQKVNLSLVQSIDGTRTCCGKHGLEACCGKPGLNIC